MTKSSISHRDLGPIVPVAQAARIASPERMAPTPDKARGAYHSFAGIESDRQPLPEKTLCKLAKIIHETVVQSANLAQSPLNSPAAGPAGMAYPGIPAGYTYLFQLAGHDLLNTSISAANTLLGEGPLNLMRQPLALRTLLGESARACPFAYETGTDGPQLRTGMVKIMAPAGAHRPWIPCGPRRDLPRAAYSDSAGKPDPAAGPNVVLIPDARNDDNLLLGQVTGLFQGIANHVARTVADGADPLTDVEARTQAVMAGFWRRILRDDLLARILHPEIHRIYTAPDARRFDTVAIDDRPSIEFAFAAGRFGHAMVRDRYRMNGRLVTLDLRQIIEISSSHRPQALPLLRDYVVDWSYYFPSTSGDPPEGFNWAFRFGPHVAVGLKLGDAAETPLSDGTTAAGTVARDLLREASGGLASVRQILDVLRHKAPAQGWGPALTGLLAPGAPKQMFADGLAALEAAITFGGLDRLDPAERQALAADPPLSLFLQFEAVALGNGGRTLGPLGSIIVAEAMWPVFSARVDAGNEAVERRAFGLVPHGMPDLLDALRSRAPHLFDT